jgi:integrase
MPDQPFDLVWCRNVDADFQLLRADRYNKIDKPKSEAGERTVPLPPTVVNTLREWKLRCPKGGHGRLGWTMGHKYQR